MLPSSWGVQEPTSERHSNGHGVGLDGAGYGDYASLPMNDPDLHDLPATASSQSELAVGFNPANSPILPAMASPKLQGIAMASAEVWNLDQHPHPPQVSTILGPPQPLRQQSAPAPARSMNFGDDVPELHVPAQSASSVRSGNAQSPEKQDRGDWAFPTNGRTSMSSLARRTTSVVEADASYSAETSKHMMDLRESSDQPKLGKTYRLDRMPPYDQEEFALTHASHKTIGTLAATAICGNDITASCFYVVGELSKNAGIYAPVCTVLSSITLHCFRHIYGEVVSSLPLNGGIYNLLLNGTTKRIASVAACLTILSYTATGVVSAVSAADYIAYCFELDRGCVVPIAVTTLAFFAFMMLVGMKESSVVASMLFLFHIGVLSYLAILSLVYLYGAGTEQFEQNMKWEHQPPVHSAIFFGFSSAMLGVSGFETSANFVEEQKPGVFPKTLTNMWASVSIINIVLPFLAIAVVPLDDLTGPESAYAVAYLAEKVAGNHLRSLVAVDALMVLSGSVLTSYVGVNGLFFRMAGDRCLPEFFQQTNAWRGTPHYSIGLFFCICASMCVILEGDITMLSAIYSLAFLLVMGLYAFAGLLMKVRRPTLPRPIVTHPVIFLAGFAMVSCAFFAVYLLHAEMLEYFVYYYLMVVFMVGLAFTRVSTYTTFLWILSRSSFAKSLLSSFISAKDKDDAQEWITEEIGRLWNQSVIYFVNHTNLSQLNRALQYIEENEEARCVRVVHVHAEEDPTPHYLIECVRLLDCVYPKMRLDCILVPGDFGPALIEHLADSLDVPVNCMFINCPKAQFRYSLDQLRGVRVILNSESSSMLEKIQTPSTLMSSKVHKQNAAGSATPFSPAIISGERSG